MPNGQWMEHLLMLMAGARGLGFEADISSLSLEEIYGLYLYLCRVLPIEGITPNNAVGSPQDD